MTSSKQIPDMNPNNRIYNRNTPYVSDPRYNSSSNFCYSSLSNAKNATKISHLDNSSSLSNFLKNFITQKKVIVILGPTASGKTGISIELAKRLNGEIISADSRTIYKYMDIGTAKPTKKEQEGVPHFGFDLIEPGERFTVADWKKYTEQKIFEIQNRGNLPIIVGGTGLYIDALVYNYQFTDDVKKTCSDREKICSNFLIIGVKTDNNTLQQRIKERLNKLFVQSLFDETEFLSVKYGWNSQAMKANIYQFVARYLSGELGLEKAKKLAYYEDWHLAKRQLTWFKRNPHITWLNLAEIVPYVLKYIQDE